MTFDCFYLRTKVNWSVEFVEFEITRLFCSNCHEASIWWQWNISDVLYLRIFDQFGFPLLVDDPDLVGEPIDEQPPLIEQRNQHREEFVLILTEIHRNSSSNSLQISGHQVESPLEIVLLHYRQTQVLSVGSTISHADVFWFVTVALGKASLEVPL